MFDEWADYVAGGRHSTAKLHIFVDLQSARQREANARVRASVGSSEGINDPLALPMRGTASPAISSGGSPGVVGECPLLPYGQSSS